MKFLFVSSTTSATKYNKIFYDSSIKQVDPSQKFMDLLIKGLSKHPNIEIKCISLLQVNKMSHKKVVWKKDKELYAKNLKYVYLGFINSRFLRYITLFVNSFKEITRWAWKEKSIKEKVIIVDPLVISGAISATIISKIFNIRTVAIITDFPQHITSINSNQKTFLNEKLRNIYDEIVFRNMKSYDAYILLTDSMNDIINRRRNKPSLVLEGSVDIELKNLTSIAPQNKHIKKIVYAGGINKKFGVENLVNAFSKLSNDDAILQVYGTGDYVSELCKIASLNPRIQYMGVVTSDEIVKIEEEATLLVNPRPVNEEFSKFSFPSKTLEYMASGTPMISTKLHGIPKEYEPYLYWFPDDTIQGIKSGLERVLANSTTELFYFGQEAKTFVLERKNNFYQAAKIKDFIDEITN